MTVSDAAYTKWLRSSGTRKCLLAEMQAYSSGSAVTRYASTLGFISEPSDTPSNTAYPDYGLSVPFVRSQLGEALRDKSRVTSGDVVLDNSTGELTSWLYDAWDGRPLTLLLGDVAWPKADFRRIFTGTIKDIRGESIRRISLQLRDKQILFDVPAMTTLIGGTDSTKDSRRPVCYGKCFNVSPVLIDSATRKYAVHDGAINAITAVREGGKLLTLSVDYTVNLTLGEITMLRALVGQLTADVEGSKTGGTYVSTTAAIAARFIAERSAVTAGEIDATALSALATLCPAVVGFYVSNDSDTVGRWLDALFTGIGGYYYFNRLGQLIVGRFDAPTGTPAVTIDADDVAAENIAMPLRWTPPKSVRIGYRRNFTVMTIADAAVTDANRQLYAQQYSIEKAVNSVAQHLLAVDDDVKPSLFADSSDAAAEATRQAALWGIIRAVYRVTGFSETQERHLNELVAVNIPSIGLNNVNARVVGLNEDLTGQRSEIEFFV